jgi:hypothetical protein
VRDPAYGNLLLPFTLGAAGAPEPAAFGPALGPQMDDRLRADLFVAAQGGGERRLSVRVARGWEDHPAWTLRLVRLAQEHPTLAVSLPLVAEDDGSGARSVAALEPLIAATGRTTADCGDLSLDPVRPRASGPALGAELAADVVALDGVELVLASPMWGAAGPGSRP